jgi:PAS domain S-box-containing protein
MVVPEAPSPTYDVRFSGPAVRKAWKMTDTDKLFELSLDLLCVAGLDGYFKKVNPAFSRVLGYTAHELTTRPIIDFVAPADRDDTLAAIGKLRDGEQILRFENRHVCKDGTHCPEQTGLLIAPRLG